MLLYSWNDSPRSSRRVLIVSAFHFLLFLLLLPLHAAAEESLRPVYLRIAGQEVTGKAAPLSDGKETYAPLEILAAVGAEGQITPKGDAVLVILKTTGRRAEVALARPRGIPMLPLSDLARFLNAVIERPDAMDAKGKPLTGQPGDTVYLLARLTAARFEDGSLQLTTSFPIPFRARRLNELTPPRSYVDCVGASVAADFRPAPLHAAEKRALRLRAGQNTAEVARVVVEFQPGFALKPGDFLANTSPDIRVGLNIGGQNPTEAEKTDKPAPSKVADSRVQPPDSRGARAPERNPKENTSVLPKEKLTPTPKSPTERGTKTSRGGNFQRDLAPVEIRAVTMTAENDHLARLEVATSGRALATVRYQAETGQLAMDIPNAYLNLAEPNSAEQTFHHPLLRGLTLTMAQDTPPMARLTLDIGRVVGFTANAQDNRLTLELRLPRNANGVLADKLIVVDAGHGGTSSGAVGNGLYEKHINLAISLKLRKALEACGARVVMTRDQDVNVDLYDRPRLANDVGADFFISIHNDSNGRPNSASGTSAYYHKGDASSRALAVCVQRAIVAVSGLPSRGALSDGILYANGLAVLRASRMPAILVEVAYINNVRDRSRLQDPDFQQNVAQAIVRGLRNYIEGYPQSLPSEPTNEMGTENEISPNSNEDSSSEEMSEE